MCPHDLVGVDAASGMNNYTDNIKLGYRLGDQLIELTPEDRLRHALIIGKTGTGKSTVLRNIAVQDIAAGRGFALLDPHGDVAEELLDCIPKSRVNDVVYFNPADLDHPIGFNLLGGVDEDARPMVAAGVVDAFRHIWRESWGPRLEHILYNCCAALLDTPNSSICGIPLLLTNERYRDRVVKHVTDIAVRNFWNEEFHSYSDKFRTEAIAPVLNKVGKLLHTPAIRNIFCQASSTINLRFIMDNHRILIANLAKGSIGDEAANLIGSFLVTRLHQAALSRTNIPKNERVDFHVLADEFQSFTTDSFAQALSEARKYGLSLTLATQYLSNVTPEVRAAALGNVGTLMVFRVGVEDAEIFVKEFEPMRHDQLAELSAYNAWVRLPSTLDRFAIKERDPIEKDFGTKDLRLARRGVSYVSRMTVVEDPLRRGKMTKWS